MTSDAISALLESLALKSLLRAGWAQRNVPGPESVAGHSWGVTFLTLALLPSDLDRERALAYAVLHDLPEVRVGDLTPADGVPRHERKAREARALAGMTEHLPNGAELSQLWHDYEKQADPESRFVRQLDRLDMALQAIIYAEQGNPGMEELLESAGSIIEDPALQAIMERLWERIRGA